MIKKTNYSIELLSGLTVALALVPEAVAFSFVAGVKPIIGLYAAFMIGIITAAIGGRPGMISGATGALAVVMVSLVSVHGVEYLFATVVLMGIIQVLFGLFRMGKFIRMVPYPVMLGFVNGLAIVIFLSQLSQFKVADEFGAMNWIQGELLYYMLGLVALTMFIIQFLPKISKSIPAPLAAIILVSLVVMVFNIPSKTVGDMASISGSLPSFNIPDVKYNFATLKIIFPYALVLAAIGLIESLLTLTLIDEMTQTRGRNSKECVAQGVANVVTGFFGGMGGCAMIGQSMINIKSGGRGRLSGIAAGIFLLCFILFASPLIEKIPVASLVGIMFVVVIGTFEWSSFRIIRKIPKSDAFVLILVSLVTVLTDLAIAVIVGVIVSALVFAWSNAKNIYLEIDKERSNKNKVVYVLHGHLFFASILTFKKLFNPKEDPKDVLIDFKYSRVWDHSGLQAIDELAEKYQKLNKQLHFLHLSQDCRRLLDKASNLVVANPDEDPHYRMVVDYNNEPGEKIED